MPEHVKTSTCLQQTNYHMFHLKIQTDDKKNYRKSLKLSKETIPREQSKVKITVLWNLESWEIIENVISLKPLPSSITLRSTQQWPFRCTAKTTDFPTRHIWFKSAFGGGHNVAALKYSISLLLLLISYFYCAIVQYWYTKSVEYFNLFSCILFLLIKHYANKHALYVNLLRQKCKACF